MALPPSKNPQCWQAPLFAHIARTSHPTTTLSSFSAARILRDNLQAHGFHIQKQTGYANKRDMITATYRPTIPIIDPTPLPAWCTPPTPPKNRASPSSAQA
ncbi:MnmC family methyltransferase [Rappaport israeli]|uniref:MnmC family methyltransferase n=1 Tax=Rappaport israeli TaxID=1839807 RepID=UPI000931303C|nr:MnmC family methyltransferase [Rappaport israeli]